MNGKDYQLQNAIMEFSHMGGVAFNSRTVPSNRRRQRQLEKLSNTLRIWTRRF